MSSLSSSVLLGPPVCTVCRIELRDFGVMTKHSYVLDHPVMCTHADGSVFLTSRSLYLQSIYNKDRWKRRI